MNEPFEELLARVRACEICADELPLGPRPVVRGTPEARILLIGQAPGTRVHAGWNAPLVFQRQSHHEVQLTWILT